MCIMCLHAFLRTNKKEAAWPFRTRFLFTTSKLVPRKKKKTNNRCNLERYSSLFNPHEWSVHTHEGAASLSRCKTRGEDLQREKDAAADGDAMTSLCNTWAISDLRSGRPRQVWALAPAKEIHHSFNLVASEQAGRCLGLPQSIHSSSSCVMRQRCSNFLFIVQDIWGILKCLFLVNRPNRKEAC